SQVSSPRVQKSFGREELESLGDQMEQMFQRLKEEEPRGVIPSETDRAAPLEYGTSASEDERGAGRLRRNPPLERVALGHPPGVAPLKRPDPVDASSLQPERPPGARPFVGSTTEEHDVPATGDLRVPPVQLVGGDLQRARERGTGLLHLAPVPQVDQQEVFPL